MLLLLDYLDYIGIALYLRDQPKTVLTLSDGGGECNLINVYIKMRERVLKETAESCTKKMPCIHIKENLSPTLRVSLLSRRSSVPTAPRPDRDALPQ